MDLNNMDLADATVLFLGGTHGSRRDANTDAMYNDIRTLIEEYAFDGNSIGGRLNGLGMLPDGPEYARFAQDIRRRMSYKREFAEDVWKILRHNNHTRRYFANGVYLRDPDIEEQKFAARPAGGGSKGITPVMIFSITITVVLLIAFLAS